MGQKGVNGMIWIIYCFGGKNAVTITNQLYLQDKSLGITVLVVKKVSLKFIPDKV